MSGGSLLVINPRKTHRQYFVEIHTNRPIDKFYSTHNFSKEAQLCRAFWRKGITESDSITYKDLEETSTLKIRL